MSMQIDVVSAEGQIHSGPAHTVFVEAVEGDMAIMPRHAPLLTRIRPGPVRIRQEDSSEDAQIFVSGGLLEVQPNLVTVLADMAERAEDIDEAEADKAKQRAEDAVNAAEEQSDIERAQAELAEAAARLQMVKKIRGSR
ncbi:F0F1 ATP synthase subunit epsilon [Salinisphaera sp. USBA-960]|uniref:F0F1 ATP synthase subunit epsilon n=1 Tax=Salinisphaera orenii TaxID=856731 RepID=UPI000DBEA169|nr:F0F1 ATP synthase subunit epsilon [Salifodinibacter halophilus]NNC27202.1 F0F1 ATP synthase subunit epsilon [Salifodinibacter halophilus]